MIAKAEAVFTDGYSWDFARAFGHESVNDYQEFFGLKKDGIAGAKTTSMMAMPRCGCMDRMSADAPAAASWPRSCMEKTWSSHFDNLGVSRTFVDAQIIAAFSALNQMSAAKIRVEGNTTNSDIWATDGPLRGSTLAWSYLPLASEGCNDRIEQRYDTSNQNWTITDKLAKVLLHECLHAMGLEHSQDSRDIMYPSIDPQKPLAYYAAPNGMLGDRNRMVGFYGEYSPPEQPDDPGSDDSEDEPSSNAEVIDFAKQMRKFLDGYIGGNPPPAAEDANMFTIGRQT